ncbi:MAG: YCF48-related protein, partial [Bacteroidota bacterium]
MNDVDVCAPSSMVTVGSNGLILRSSDDGAHWTFPMGLPTNSLAAVDFFDSLVGIAVGSLGNIQKTTDGGEGWTEILSGFSAQLKSVQFISANEVWAGGQPMSGGTVAPYILQSTDGGFVWSNKSRSMDQAFSILGLSFTSNARGWVGGNSYIYMTSDGGLSWNPSRMNTSEFISDLLFVDSLNGFAVGQRSNQGLILRTTNGGSSWTSQSFSTIGSLTRLSFPTADTGYAAGWYGAVLRTTNRGLSWTNQSVPTGNSLFDVEFASGRVGWVPVRDS